MVRAVYDVSSSTSFQNLEVWLNELDTYATKKDLVKMLVGNKIDKDSREVSRSDGLQFARRNSMLFIEARSVPEPRGAAVDHFSPLYTPSAKTRDGVQQAFQELVQKVLQTPSLYSTEEHRDTLDPMAPPTSDGAWCGGSCTVT